MTGLISKKTLLRYVRLQIILGTVVAVLCFMVWPLRYFYHSVYSAYEETPPSYTGTVTMDEIVLQAFMPKEGHLQEIHAACEVADVHSMDRVFVTLYDAEYQIVYQEVLHFFEIETYGEILITPDLDVTPGGTYYLGLNVHFDSIGTLKAAYADRDLLKLDECGAFSYAGTWYENQAMLIRFHYTAQYSGGFLALCIAGVIACGSLLYVGIVLVIELLKKKNGIPQFLRGGLIGLLAAGVLFIGFCFYQLCIARLFGGALWDMLIYTAACLIALGVLLYACHKGAQRIGDMQKRQNERGREEKESGRKLWINYLQILCLTGLFYEGTAYVNASIQWKQDLARNAVFLLFGLFVILTLKFRQVVNVFSVLWCLFLIPAGMVYCRLYGGGEHGTEVARLFVAAAALWGIVLIHTIRNIKKLREQRLNIPLAVCFGLMCICMMVNSLGKMWPFMMTVTFTLFYMQDYTEEQKDQIVHHMLGALLLHFCLMIVMCCLHRPYHYYRFNRYPMWFHTVASTGIYLSAVAAAALLRLFLTIRDSGTVFRKAWTRWAAYGVVLAYITLAMPRTALMAVAGTAAALAIGAAIVYRPKLRSYLQVAGMMLASLLISLPVVYTVTRCVPAVVNEPVYLNGDEDFDEAVRVGEAPDSGRYMNVRALVRLWAGRLWVPQEFIEKYLEDHASGNLPLRVLTELASGQITGLPEITDEKEEDFILNEMSNGRLAIFLDYLEHLTWTGHAQMGFDGEYEMLSGHAHNSFIQNAFDFGIPAGVLSLLLILLMIFLAVYRIWTGKERSEKQFAVFLTGCAFLLVSLTEYVSNPCMPLCFSTLFLLITMRTEKIVVK
ncbi:MAG: hypothetical protein NC409_03255 [Clostridium sp.]|nr:hypothetical protein [Clostridium sp.]